MRGHLYYLRITDPANACDFMEKLGTVGSVCNSGVGTATSESDRWCVLKSWAATVNSLRKLLHSIDLHVDHVESVNSIGEGTSLSKQIPLFGGA